MRYCTECGKKIAKTYKFCPDCGQPINAEEVNTYEESNNNFIIVDSDSNLDNEVLIIKESSNEDEKNLNESIEEEVVLNSEAVAELTLDSNKDSNYSSSNFTLVNNVYEEEDKTLANMPKKEVKISGTKLNISDAIYENFKSINSNNKNIKKAIAILGCVCTIGVLSMGAYKSLSKNENIEIEESYAHLANKNLVSYNNDSMNGDYIISESSDMVLSVNALNNYNYKDLYIARNEIIARHGYIFNDCPKLQSYFESKTWYKADKSFSGKLENKIEVTNLSAITSMEFLKMSYEENDKVNLDFVFSDSNKRELTNKEIKDLNDWQLIVAKNEIYARYGFVFSTKELKQHFSSKKWYEENSSVDNNVTLNDIEYKNIDNIVKEQDKRIIKKLNHDL